MEQELPEGKTATLAGTSYGMGETSKEQDLILNLKAAGFDGTLIQEFLDCWKAGETTEQMRLLSQKRKGLLDQVHREEKQIHCLDYLAYHIQKTRTSR